MLGFIPISAAPISSLPAEDGTFVALTGQVITSQQGQLQPQLQGASITSAQGTLGIERGVTLTGQVITSQQGQFMPRLSQLTITSSRGAIVPEVAVVLTGAVITTQTQSVGYITVSGGNVTVQLDLAGKNVFQGTLTPEVQAGTNATTFSPTPSVTTNTSSTQAFNNAIGHVRHQSPYVHDKYWVVGEIEDGSASDWQTCIISPTSEDSYVNVSPDDRTFAFADVPNWHAGYAIADLNPKFGGNSFQYFADSQLQYSGVPRKWGLGVLFGVGVEGNMAQLRVRTEDRFLTYPNRTRYLVYEELHDDEVSGFATDHGVELAHDIDCSRYESSSGAEDGPVNHALGVVPLRPTKTPLRGSSPAFYRVTHALVFHPSLWNDGTNDNWVPTYNKVSKDLNPAVNVQTVTNDVQIRSWTGVASLWAMNDTMVTVHSGYGNIAYLAYLAGTSGAPRTPSYVAVIAMDLETQEVFSHVVKALGAKATPLTTENLTYQEEFPHRAVSEAIKLSDGRSVTQFAIRGFVVNLSWTSGTQHNPTITPKDGPSTGTICTGVDFLETRGETVYHVMLRGNSGTPTAFRPVYNDAASTSASWTVPGSDLWSWSLTFSASSKATQFYSGSHKGKQTWIAETVYDDNAVNNLEAGNRRSGEAWLDFWSAQNPILSVEVTGSVGAVEIFASTCGLDIALSGHQIQSYQSNGLISGENKSAALAGLQSFVNYTGVRGAEHVSVPLVGFGAEVSYGRMSLIGDPVDVKLTGLHCCFAVNEMTTGLQRLTGHTITSQQGKFLPQLQGTAITTSQGTLTPSVDLLVGQVITSASGTLIPLLNPNCAGAAVTCSQGSLKPAEDIPLTGQSATVSRGALGVSIAVTLTGQQITCTKGNVSIRVDDQGDLTGLSSTCSGGTLTPRVTVSLTTPAIAVSRGAMGVVLVKALTGSSCAVGTSTLAVAITRLLPSELMTMAYGAMPLHVDNFPAVTGVQALCQLGTATHNGTPFGKDVNLWAYAELEKLELYASSLPEDTEKFVTITPKR